MSLHYQDLFASASSEEIPRNEEKVFVHDKTAIFSWHMEKREELIYVALRVDVKRFFGIIEYGVHAVLEFNPTLPPRDLPVDEYVSLGFF